MRNAGLSRNKHTPVVLSSLFHWSNNTSIRLPLPRLSNIYSSDYSGGTELTTQERAIVCNRLPAYGLRFEFKPKYLPTWVSSQKHELPFKVSTRENEQESSLPGNQLKDPDLLHNLSFVNGDWVKAKSGKTFEVVG